MAKNVNAGDVKRTDLLLVDPFEIQVNPADRGRFTTPSDEAIRDYAIQFADPTIGQIQAVEGRVVKHDGDRIHLILGFTRVAAARLLRTGFEHDSIRYHNPEFRISVRVRDCSDLEAVKRNIVENNSRLAMSPIDHAYNQRRLRDMGESDPDIATIYGWQTGQVTRCAQLLQLTEDQQMLIHLNQMSQQSGLLLLELAPADRQRVIGDARKENGVVDGTKVRSMVRDIRGEQAPDPAEKSDDGDATDKTKGTTRTEADNRSHTGDARGSRGSSAGTTRTPREPKRGDSKLARSQREVRDFFDVQGKRDDNIGYLAKIVVEFCNGLTNEGELIEALEQYAGTC